MTPKQQIIGTLGIALIMLAIWVQYGSTIKQILKIGQPSTSLTSTFAEVLGAYGAYKLTTGLLNKTPTPVGSGGGGSEEEEPVEEAPLEGAPIGE